MCLQTGRLVLLTSSACSSERASLLAASSFIETIERRQGLRISCLEEIAFRMGYIDSERLSSLAHEYGSSDYGQYLKQLLTQSIY